MSRSSYRSYRTYKRQSWEDKLRALSDDELIQAREKTQYFENLWKLVGGTTYGQYKGRRELIDTIMKERGL